MAAKKTKHLGKEPSNANRWAFGISGVLAFLLGLFVLGKPFFAGLELPTVNWLFGLFATVSGLGMITSGLIDQLDNHTFFEGVTSLVIGLMMMFMIGLTPAMGAMLIVVWLFSVGIYQSMAGIMALPYAIAWAMILAGLASVTLGTILLFNPEHALTSIGYYLGTYGFVLILGTIFHGKEMSA